MCTSLEAKEETDVCPGIEKTMEPSFPMVARVEEGVMFTLELASG